MSDELETALETALAAARAGARALRRRPTSAAMKGGDPINLVTDRDLASQRAVFGLIRRAFPDHRLIGEEDPDALAVPPDGPTWTVDPLDGTSNFAHGHVPYGVSVGHARDGRALVGAIALPASGALAWAVRGRGAFLRRAGRVTRLRVSERATLAEALVLTGYGYARDGYPAWLRRFGRAVSAAQSVRMTGAAVADQVSLAAGRVDVVWEDEYQPWDYAAGALLVEEAGGRGSTIEGAPLPGRPTSFLGTNGRLHEEMVRFLASP
jgi:myo-inositol-1(or 4)-monophosphatase